jgi:hypothetical protein
MALTCHQAESMTEESLQFFLVSNGTFRQLKLLVCGLIIAALRVKVVIIFFSKTRKFKILT